MRWTITVEVQEKRRGEWQEEVSPRYSFSGAPIQADPIGSALLLDPEERDWRWRTTGEHGDGQRRIRVTVQEGVTGR